MKRLFSVVLLLFSLHVALSVRFYTEENQLCITECAKNGESYYWCNTDDGWGYCSIQENVDHRGRPCRDDHSCSKHGANDYSWCYVDSANNWGYCGTQSENLKLIASNGYYCTNECQQSDFSNGKYYWCNTTMEGWDYCSPEEGLDYSGQKCRPDHSCDKHGQDYYWCYIDGEDNWGYCGIEGESKHLTERGYYCATECEMNGEDYYWCRHYDGWGYCSLTENSDSHGRACRADSDCAKHDGTWYTWCRGNEENDWDYCGQISRDSSFEIASPSVKLKQKVLYYEYDKINCVLTEWIFIENKGIRQNFFKKYEKSAYELIDNWKVREISSKSAQGRYSQNKLVRIDLQGKFNDENNICFANIQIQMNIPRPKGKSTTIATVLLEMGEDFPLEHIRRAFMSSLKEKGSIKLRKKKYYKDQKTSKCKGLIKYGDSKKCSSKKDKKKGK